MDSNELSKRMLESQKMFSNNSPRLLICICVDASVSMNKIIEKINNGIVGFLDKTNKDLIASDAVELAVYSFGSSVELICPFGSAENGLKIMRGRKGIIADQAESKLGECLHVAVKALTERQMKYRENNIPIYRPWLLVFSDGEATDVNTYKQEVREVNELIAQKHLKTKVFSSETNSENLLKLSGMGAISEIDELSVMDFFEMLSRSVTSASIEGIIVGNDIMEKNMI